MTLGTGQADHINKVDGLHNIAMGHMFFAKMFLLSLKFIYGKPFCGTMTLIAYTTLRHFS